MAKGLLRFALVTALTLLVTPYVSRAFDRLADRAPRGSFLEDALLEIGDRYASGLIRSLWEALGDLVFGSK